MLLTAVLLSTVLLLAAVLLLATILLLATMLAFACELADNAIEEAHCECVKGCEGVCGRRR